MFVVVLCTARLTMISTDDPFRLSTVIQGLQMKTLRTECVSELVKSSSAVLPVRHTHITDLFVFTS